MNRPHRRILGGQGAFFALTFLVSWACWLPVIFFRQNPLNTGFLLLYGAGLCGPSLAALYLAYQDQGKAGLLAFLRRALELKFPLAGWAAILLFWPAAFGLAALLASRLGSSPYPYSPLWKVFEAQPGLLLPQLLAWGLAGPLSGEYGWRGRAQDGLEAGWGRMGAALAIGVAGALWQLPLFYMLGTLQSNLSLPVYLLHTLVQAVLFGAVYSGTGRKLGAVVLFHALYNVVLSFVPLLDPVTFFALVGVETLSAVLIGVWWKTHPR